MTETIRTDVAPAIVVVRRRSRVAVAFLVLLMLGVVALAIVAFAAPPDGVTRRDGDDVWRFVGRFHPALVHLPIGAIALVPLMELAGSTRRWRALRDAAGFVLGVGALGGVVAVALGYLLARFDGNKGETLTYHMIAGLVTAGLGVITLGLRMRARRLGGAFAGFVYVVSLLLLIGAVTIAGHLGGQLTYGESYFSSVAPRPIAPYLGPIDGDRAPAPPVPEFTPAPTTTPTTAPTDVAPSATAPAAVSFARDVLPVFAQSCVSCHGPAKVKGGLRLDSFAELAKGGDSGDAIVAGNAEMSDLYHRMTLPIDLDEAMPPPGAKRRPTAEQIATVKRWIDAGAKDD